MSTAREQLAALLTEIANKARIRGAHLSDSCIEILADGLVARGVSSLRAPQSGPLLPDTFVERAIRTALAQPEYKLEGDTVVGLSGAEASFIRQKYAERNSGAETPPQPTEQQNGRA